MIKLDQVCTDKIRLKEDKAFRRKTAINQGREIRREDAVLTVEEFFQKDKMGSDAETVMVYMVNFTKHPKRGLVYYV